MGLSVPYVVWDVHITCFTWILQASGIFQASTAVVLCQFRVSKGAQGAALFPLGQLC